MVFLTFASIYHCKKCYWTPCSKKAVFYNGKLTHVSKKHVVCNENCGRCSQDMVDDKNYIFEAQKLWHGRPTETKHKLRSRFRWFGALESSAVNCVAFGKTLKSTFPCVPTPESIVFCEASPPLLGPLLRPAFYLHPTKSSPLAPTTDIEIQTHRKCTTLGNK